MQKRGQVSMEFLITVAFALVMVIPLMVLFYQNTNSTKGELDSQQSLLIARKIVDTANEVYYLGAPSTVLLKVVVPGQVNEIRIMGNEVTIATEDGNEVVAIAAMNLTGNISSSHGLRYLRVSAIPGGVNVTDVS